MLAHVHVADRFNHNGSSGLRDIVNPPGSTARVRQHLASGQGEVDPDVVFRTLAAVGFDGIVFAWKECATNASRVIRTGMQRHIDKCRARP